MIDLTNEQIRMMVAEELGASWYLTPKSSFDPSRKRNRFLVFTYLYNLDGTCELDKADGTERLTSFPYMWDNGRIPDYPCDLNACTEIESVVNNSKDAAKYVRFLCDEILDFISEDEVLSFSGWALMRMTKATAYQKCIAFLKLRNRI